jgi:hypothetical protein
MDEPSLDRDWGVEPQSQPADGQQLLADAMVVD